MPVTNPQWRRALAPLLACLITISYHTAASAKELVLRSGIQQNTLIELYTSQGCSSCPSADRWLGKLQHHSELWNKLIAVAFHVDYWDYIGWKDQLAQPAFSKRQRQYSREKGVTTVYTPGFLVNGKEWRNWLFNRQLPPNETTAGELTLKIAGDVITATYQPYTPVTDALRLNVALLGVGLVADIKRGENAGKKLPQDFSVLVFKQEDSANRHWQTQLPSVESVNGARHAIAAWVSLGQPGSAWGRNSPRYRQWADGCQNIRGQNTVFTNILDNIVNRR